MLWSTLFNALGRQSLRITAHRHVHLTADRKIIEELLAQQGDVVECDLELKLNAKGDPYLAPVIDKPKEATLSKRNRHKIIKKVSP